MGLTPGQTLRNGHYHIEKNLGQGGFGTTYKAFHTYFEAPCVIKTPNDHLSNDPEYPKYLKRFLREGQMLRKLCSARHSHIVYVSDLFEEANAHYLVMDYIDGETLYHRVFQQGPLPETEAVEYIRQMGEALEIAHQAGIIHRDANPNNIMLSNGSAMLIDFGIAGEIVPKTITSKMGCSAFAPYEQVKQFHSPREELRKLCCLPTVDVYTLAGTLYYAVTGKLPMYALDRKYDGIPLEPPTQHNKQLSKRIERAILSGLALEYQDRPQSMREFLQQLEPEPEPPVPQRYQRLRELLAAGKLLQPLELKPELSTLSTPQRYQRLRKLLAAGKWKEADKETARVMLEVAGRTEQGYLNTKSIETFPCAELRTIDQLWVKSSGERFGFSVQKRIYCEVNKDWRRFCDRVEWGVNNGSLFHYWTLTFDLSPPEGHLPAAAAIYRFEPTDNSGVTVGFVGSGVSSLASRLVKCNL